MRQIRQAGSQARMAYHDVRQDEAEGKASQTEAGTVQLSGAERGRQVEGQGEVDRLNADAGRQAGRLAGKQDETSKHVRRQARRGTTKQPGRPRHTGMVTKRES